MAKAISDTGFLEVFVGTVLGTPGSHFSAILRLCLLVGPLSAFFNNTPVTAMMVPVVKNWCSRLGFDVAKLGMPLAFAAQLGGSLTLMGSPTNFAARKIYAESDYDLGFFELTIVAAPLFVIGTLFISIMSPLVLGKKSKAAGEPLVLTRQFSGDIVDGRFRVSFIVNNKGPFSWGRIKVPDAGFDRLEGVFGVKVVVRDDLEVWGEGIQGSEEVCLKAGDVVVFRASAEGIAELRRTTGLRLTTDSESHKLGHGRKKRLIFEVELPPTSKLLGVPVSSERLREEYGCALMAVRARKEGVAPADHSKVNARVANERAEVEDLPDDIVHRSSRWSNGTYGTILSEPSSIILDVPSMKMLVPDTTAVTTFDGFILNDGDVMLLESNPKRVGSPVWVRDFGIVRAIAHSTPPKLGRKRDTVRSIGALTGALLAIGLFAASSQVSALDHFSLTNNLILLVLFLLATKTLTVEDVYESMNGRVLLTMVGAFPLGEAIQAVGLDSWAGTSLVSAFAPLGKIGSYIAIYVVCAGLSNLISNIAVIAMVAPVSIQIAQMQGLSLKSMVICTTLATSAVFTFPIGHQTNLMVLPLGNYGWGDFLTLGGGLQLVHGIACCLICITLA
ncbi:unnamed protein product [Polarella glacialis]|uniref:Citrate transporter-like domain-containing protein n=1 Tax=Polarella glacialis TaxID=89957 RepID=A0A813EBK4_POLGL|nr:unnamed protein product [Polarella glacialis]